MNADMQDFEGPSCQNGLLFMVRFSSRTYGILGNVNSTWKNHQNLPITILFQCFRKKGGQIFYTKICRILSILDLLRLGTTSLFELGG